MKTQFCIMSPKLAKSHQDLYQTMIDNLQKNRIISLCLNLLIKYHNSQQMIPDRKQILWLKIYKVMFQVKIQQWCHKQRVIAQPFARTKRFLMKALHVLQNQKALCLPFESSSSPKRRHNRKRRLKKKHHLSLVKRIAPQRPKTRHSSL